MFEKRKGDEFSTIYVLGHKALTSNYLGLIRFNYRIWVLGVLPNLTKFHYINDYMIKSSLLHMIYNNLIIFLFFFFFLTNFRQKLTIFL